MSSEWDTTKKIDDVNPDTVCNYLKTKRKYGREHNRSKSISFSIGRGDCDEVISARTTISLNIKTGTVVMAHGLRWAGKLIYPTTCHKKYDCRTESAKKAYIDAREATHKAYTLKWKNYYITHREKTRKYCTDYYANNRENIRAKQKARAVNP